MRDAQSMASAQNKGRVLIIDDEPQQLSMCCRILSRAGFTVQTALTGQSVMEQLDNTTVDVVLSDITMPDMDGIELLQKVHERDPDLPVVLMTGSSDLGTAVKAIEFGALRYLLKPLSSALLIKATEDAVHLAKIAHLKRRTVEMAQNGRTQTFDFTDCDTRFDAALEHLHMAYQPIVRWSDRTIYAYEALVRTKEPTLRNPEYLFAAAEYLERVHDIGRLIRHSIAATMLASPTPYCVFVNMHPHDLIDDDLLANSSLLGRVARSVVMEVTERTTIGEIDHAKPKLDILRQLGYRLAIDDLGAGYAGLTSFAQLQPEIIKLDMSLTRSVNQEPTKQKLIQSMTSLCRELGILVVAEGIETVEERDSLVASGCDLMQGYLFARPGEPFTTTINFGEAKS